MKKELIEFIKEKGSARPHELKLALGLSAVSIHKYLKSLVQDGILLKQGHPPLVFYALAKKADEGARLPAQDLDRSVRRFIDERYVYISPTGHILNGLEGFKAWVINTRQAKQFLSLTDEFVRVRKDADGFFTKGHSFAFIKATQKLKNTFSTVHLDEVYYQDFYSLPKFGKTRLGALVLHAKQAQSRPLIGQLARECEEVIRGLIRMLSVDAIAWTPHSIPRQLPFLKEFQRVFNLRLPEIKLIKAYSGEIPVAQKSLSKLEERIQNARDTIFIRKTPPAPRRVLIIDDAVGSGATLNETALKLKSLPSVKSVYGFAIVGSYKGFEVIREA